MAFENKAEEIRERKEEDSKLKVKSTLGMMKPNAAGRSWKFGKDKLKRQMTQNTAAKLIQLALLKRKRIKEKVTAAKFMHTERCL